MGMLKNKHEVSPDGMIYRIEDDGSITKVARILPNDEIEPLGNTKVVGDKAIKKIIFPVNKIMALITIVSVIALLILALNTQYGSDTGAPAPAPAPAFQSEWSKKVAALPIGGTFTFGSYEQDGNTSNGKEKLEWIVLDKQDAFVTLISKQCLDAQQYNESKSAVSWEASTLKSWLNDYFANTAFSKDEKEKIFSFNTDKVALLDYEEAEKYFKGDESRRCNPTGYAMERGVFKGNSGTANWWLSTPVFGSRAMYIGLRGNIAREGEDVSVSNHSIRPVIKLKI